MFVDLFKGSADGMFARFLYFVLCIAGNNIFISNGMESPKLLNNILAAVNFSLPSFKDSE